MLRRAVAPTSFLAFVLLGCGGHSAVSSPSKAATAGARATVARAFTSLGSALGNNRWALQFNPLASVSTGIAANPPPDVDDTLGGSPESTIPTFYENEQIGAWEQVTDTSSDHREDYYLDEAKSNPAGYNLVTGTTEASGATTSIEHYEFTAGAYAGAYGDSTSTSFDGDDETSDDDLWTCSYDSVMPDGTIFKGVFSYKGLALTSAGTTTYPDAKTDTFSAQFDKDDVGKMTFSTREGLQLVAEFKSDTRATGTLTGNAEGLPASFTLDDQGVKVRFHDGSTTEFKSEANAVSKQALQTHRARVTARRRR